MANKETHILSKAAYDKYTQELADLKGPIRDKNIQDLKEARSQGDLSENADYDAARDKQAEIEGRIKEIERLLKVSSVADETNVIGNLFKTIEVHFIDDDEDDEFTIVDTHEADVMNNKISSSSPLGEKLLHAKVGQKVTIEPDEAEPYNVIIISIK